VTAAVFFLPMILAGLVWPSAMRWTKRLIEILIALIVSKFVIVAVISLATAALADPGGGGFGTVMGAAALMLMAAFSPFALLKLVPMIEGTGIDHLQGKGRKPIESMRSGGGVNQVVSVMRAKTRSRNGQGLAVAGAGSSTAVGAAGAAGIAAARVAKTAAKAPGRSAEQQAGMAKTVSSGSDRPKKVTGEDVAAPARGARRDEQGGGKR
jgi:hypothetical protein